MANQTPPRLLMRFFRWFCHPRLVDHIEGDLLEEYSGRLKTMGKRKADIKFIIDVLLLLRPGIVRPLRGYRSVNGHGMIKSYCRTSLRSIQRNRLFSFINIAGLATSMSAGLLLITIVYEMSQYDRFHLNQKSIYRIIDDYHDSNGNSFPMATTSVRAGRKIGTEFSGVRDVVIVQHGLSGDFQVADKSIPLKGFWTEPGFFKIFSFDLAKGNPETALIEPNSIVLTEMAARKLFGTTDVLGKSIASKHDATNSFTITGVLRDIPKFSHLQFDALGSFSTIALADGENDAAFGWENIWSNYVYVLLEEGTSPEDLQAQLDRLSKKENALSKDLQVYLRHQPLTAIALGESLENQPGPVMSSNLVWFLGGLSLIVLISACINYTNLSIARSLKRSREIGIRKIVGAKKYQVLIQFMAEGIIISLASLVLASGIFYVIRPIFISLTPSLARLLTLDLTGPVIMFFVLFTLATGMLAGFLPGMFYTRINAITIVKKVSSIRSGSKLTARKILLVMQYSLSVILITSVVVIYRQYQHFLSADLGFSTENILNIKLQDVRPEILSKNLEEIPAITETSRSFMITSVGNNYYTHVQYAGQQDSLQAWYNKIDANYIPLFNFNFKAGRNFSKRNDGAIESEVIVNEKLIQQLNIGNGKPENAVGEIVRVQGMDLQIVGVLSNFHYSTLDKKIGPFIFRNTGGNFNYVNIKLSGDNIPATMLQVEDAWKRTGSSLPFEASFYDDMIQRAYNEYSSMTKVIGYLAALAVVIAALGLIGMVVYSTEARLLEVSIRKVFGAPVRHLVFTLGKSFIILLIIAGLISIPVTHFFFTRVVLPGIAYHSTIGLFELTIGYLGIMLISLVVIGAQTLKIAAANPADTLRNE